MSTLISFFRGAESQRGQAILLVAVTMMGMLMMVGLAIDAGQLYSSRRTMQEAADAGAYAGAVVLYQEGTQAQARAAAIYDTALNGYTDGLDGWTVTVNAPPASGPNAGNNRYVEVRISGNVQTALVPGQGVFTFVSVRGVAGAEPLNNDYAIMALDRGNVACAFEASPNADIHITGGGILVNSRSNTAACNDQNDSARFTITPPSENSIDITGNTANAWPTGMSVVTSHPPQADPFAGYPKPPLTGCDPVFPNNPCTTFNSLPEGAVRTLNPGVYTVAITSSGGTIWIANPGIYILKGVLGSGQNARTLDLAGNADLYSAGLDVWTGHPATCAANCGILLFLTHTNYPAAFRPGIDSCGQFNLQGNSETRIAAMTTGTYKNMLVYQDPACSDPLWYVKMGGNGALAGTGTIYVPNNEFILDGNAATLTGSQLVAKTISLQNGDITIDFVPTTSAQPILPRLSE